MVLLLSRALCAAVLLALTRAAAIPDVYEVANSTIAPVDPTTAHTLETRARNTWYMSLGSSFAAGPGIMPYEHAQAERSVDNYPHYFARSGRIKAGRLELLDRTVAGSTLSHLYNHVQNRNGMDFPVRVSSIPTDAKLITITSGGNDINYIGALAGRTDCADPRYDGDVVARYKAALNAIKRRAPNAKIVLVEYPTVLGNAARSGRQIAGLPLSKAQVDKYARCGDRLSDITRRAADNMDKVYRLNVAEMSMGHGVGDGDSWTNGAENRNDNGDDQGVAWHPNRRGMREVGRLLTDWYCREFAGDCN
jgi:lysophospholipase L1-like esterase